MSGAAQPASSMRRLISGTARAASSTLTVMRTISEPAAASSTHCRAVPAASAVSVLVIDCTTTGAPPPTVTPPMRTACVGRRGASGEASLVTVGMLASGASAAARGAPYARRRMADGPDEPDDELPLFAPEPSWEMPEEARQVLLTSLDSPDPEVRLEAVEMLAHSLDDGLAMRGLEIARSDPEEEIRAAAASALAPALAAVVAAREDPEAPEPPLSGE